MQGNRRLTNPRDARSAPDPRADAHAAFVRDWTRALVNHHDYVPLSGAAATQLIERLVDQLVMAFCADPVLVDAAADVGTALVDAHVVSDAALGRSLAVIGTHLLPASGWPGEGEGGQREPEGEGQAAAARLGSVQGALAAGYLRAVRDRMFAQQEAIRLAEREARQRVEEQLRASDARFRAVFNESGVGIGLADMEGDIVEVNTAFVTMLGYSAEEFRRLRVVDFTGSDTDEMRAAYADLTSGVRDHVRLEHPFPHRDGRTVWTNLHVSLLRDAGGAPRYTLTIAEDISEQRLLRERLHSQVRHDPLTGLPNRILFFERLRAACAVEGARVGVCSVDLDGFKPINDTVGHGVGDQLLAAVARRLERYAVDNGHVVARMGGDEFVVLVAASTGIAQMKQVATDVLDAVAAPYDIGPHHLMITASAGVVERPVASTTPAELIKAADITLYWAKRAGRGRYAVFDEERNRQESSQLTLAASMPAAIERGEFFLEYQPIVRLRDRTVQGVEALVRWAHPTLGRILPGRFVGIAEDTGAIVPLGRWVLERACAQAERWRREFPWMRLVMSVNLSVLQAREPDIVSDVAGLLDAYHLPPDALQLELTESALMGPAGRPLAALHELDAMGVRIAIDDFGSGYSNLAYLDSLPVRTLKLDGAFVRPPVHNRGSADVITAALVPLAHDLGLEVVAEGVESAEQADRLRGLRCDLAQGWFFARPASAADIEHVLSAMSTPPTAVGWVRS